MKMYIIVCFLSDERHGPENFLLTITLIYLGSFIGGGGFFSSPLVPYDVQIISKFSFPQKMKIRTLTPISTLKIIQNKKEKKILVIGVLPTTLMFYFNYICIS